MKTRIKGLVLFMTALVMTMMFGVMVSAEVVTPVKVTGVKQTDASQSAIYYTWDDINDDYKYHIEVSTNGVDYTEVDSWSINDVLLTGLNPGTSYYVRIRASVRDYDTYTDVYGPYSDVVEMITEPDDVTNLVQTATTINSFSVAWTAVPGASYYNVYKYVGGVETLAGTTVAPSGSFTNVSVVDFGVVIKPVKVASTGYVAEGYGTSLSQYSIKMLPVKSTGLYVSAHSEKNKKASIGWTSNYDADGYQVQVFRGTSKKVWKTVNTTSSYAEITKVKNNYVYRIQVRAYVEVNGQKFYGDWSDEFRMAVPKVKLKSASAKHITLSWNKVKNAKSYTIYMSDKQNKGFKKVKTLKKTTIKITKFKKKAIKKNKVYYFKIVVNMKQGKKTVKVNSPYTHRVTRY